MNNAYSLIAIFVKNLFSMHLQLLELYVITNEIVNILHDKLKHILYMLEAYQHLKAPQDC